MLNELAKECHEIARSKGFYERAGEGESFLSEKLLLVVSEITEAQDAIRDGDELGEALEIADALIRLLDYAEFRGIDIDAVVRRKIDFNKTRPYMHGRAKAI